MEELDICFAEDSTEHMINALQYAEENGIRVGRYRDGDVIPMGDGAVTLTFYVGPYPELDMNNASAMTMIRYGERTILFTADADTKGQASLTARVPTRDLKADLLKYPHHGKRPLDKAFYEAVSPEIAIVTNKRVEDWKGVRYLKKHKIPYYYTNMYEKKIPLYLHLMTDGEHWVIERVRADLVESF